MHNELKTDTYGNFGFRFSLTDTSMLPVQLYSVGWENETSPSYYWENTNRDAYGYLFQYTIQGEGAIRIGADSHRLTAGQAFFVEIPGDHCYYLPETSSQWEFIFIYLRGEEAKRAWKTCTDQHGMILELKGSSPLVQLAAVLFREAAAMRIKDGYQAASLAFQFLMELYRQESFRTEEEVWPEEVTIGVAYLEEHYAAIDSIDDAARAAGITKHHFIRVFHRYVGTTPLQYLTKVRLEHAVKLLWDGSLAIGDIAKAVGYSSGNYFIKVFHSYVGMSPGEFRKGKSKPVFNHIMFG